MLYIIGVYIYIVGFILVMDNLQLKKLILLIMFQ